MNDFKSSSSNLIILFGDSYPMLKSVEYIQKIIIFFLAVPPNEINYGVRNIKLCKIQNQPFAGFLKNFAKFTEIHLCRSFLNKVASELWWDFMRNFFIEHLRATASENERLSSVQNW